ncbi:aldo/keto reductase [Martelella mediterranea]|uniref:Aryl-alcohol dehydrogenase-like predicted oxidoreductase n=1 Tax=Martelella mediterranea TaxID=293089 RepID=A0A4R3NVG2_9HYPH|nr:aldo/keto reductase [Martelella mediterranea]TCT41121.1 aryl-alcohol dehydrogenase-like predicted oxidoreductase [Martelella mediterranea]
MTIHPKTTHQLPLRRLGKTDMAITRTGFGAWAIGGGDWAAGWGSQDDDDSISAIHRAISLGVNWIDTASVYGLGHSEEVVGRAIRDIPQAERPFIFTKCGLEWDEQNRHEKPRRIGHPDRIRVQTEESLQRLGVERIDLMQVHWPSEDVPLAEYWGALSKLKAEGKVRAIGLSNHNATQLQEAEAVAHVDTLQPPFSAIRRDTAEQLLPWARGHDTAVICYSPMQAGLLTGRFSEDRAANLPDDDWRKNAEQFNGDKLRANLALAEALKPVAKRHGVSQAAIAIAWVLAWPGLTGAIVGARNPDQIDGWIAAASLDLDDDDMNEIAEAIKRTGAGSGPMRP